MGNKNFEVKENRCYFGEKFTLTFLYDVFGFSTIRNKFKSELAQGKENYPKLVVDFENKDIYVKDDWIYKKNKFLNLVNPLFSYFRIKLLYYFIVYTLFVFILTIFLLAGDNSIGIKEFITSNRFFTELFLGIFLIIGYIIVPIHTFVMFIKSIKSSNSCGIWFIREIENINKYYNSSIFEETLKFINFLRYKFTLKNILKFIFVDVGEYTISRFLRILIDLLILFGLYKLLVWSLLGDHTIIFILTAIMFSYSFIISVLSNFYSFINFVFCKLYRTYLDKEEKYHYLNSKYLDKEIEKRIKEDLD